MHLLLQLPMHACMQEYNNNRYRQVSLQVNTYSYSVTVYCYSIMHVTLMNRWLLAGSREI